MTQLDQCGRCKSNLGQRRQAFVNPSLEPAQLARIASDL
jgi:hypothetical protein